MKHKLALLLALLLLFALPACSSDSGDESTDGDTPTDGDNEEDGDDETDGDTDEDGDVPEDGDTPEDGDELDGDGEEDGDTDEDGDVPEDGDEEQELDRGLPVNLPFSFTREDVGEPVTAEEVSAFTRKLTALWKQVDYWNWIYRTSHGHDASTGDPDWMIWWSSVEAVKSGDTVTFKHNASGGGHNVYIPTPRMLAQAITGYLLTEDPAMGRVVEQYSKGMAAAAMGMVYDENDPEPFLMSRNFVTYNHSFEIDGGRKKAVDFTDWYSPYEEWNTERFKYENNPYWGEVWVTNMRSKDDVPHMLRVAPWLIYGKAFIEDDTIREAVELALFYLEGFTRDIVDHGYYIRTKDANGVPYIPKQDLASLIDYDLIGIKNAECTARLTCSLISYGEPLTNECELGFGGSYETLAVRNHYYNLAIIRNFHLSSLLMALTLQKNDAARDLLTGLAQRMDNDWALTPEQFPTTDHDRWWGERATFLLQAASQGLPLTSQEVRLIHERYSAAADDYSTWELWDLWDESVGDGTYSLKPRSDGHRVGIEDIAFVLEYCFSPFRNQTGAPLVDCDIVRDLSRWGEADE